MNILFRRCLMTAVLLMAVISAHAQSTVTVTGTVYDEKGESLPGAIVMVPGQVAGTSKVSTSTDIDGKYTVSCAPGEELQFHFLGYKSLTRKVEGKTKIDVTLEPDVAMSLDEAVVIGYGSVKKADLTGSVTNVKMADIRDMPVTNIDAALQGRVAGADIMSTSGEPGATTSIRIRGTRSIEASNEPLIVVDGVMDAISDLNDLNPEDVESISVLKDASSTAIYGSRGSNGVIIITTKAGKADSTTSKPNITFKAEAGFSQLPRKLDIMNAQEFAVYRNEYQVGQASQSEKPSVTWETPVSDLVLPDPASYGRGTDWLDEVTRIAPYQNYFLSISGGKGKTNYYSSFGYNDDQGIVKKSGQQRISGNFSINHDLFKWMRVGYKMNYTWRHTDQTLASIGGTSYWNAAMYLSPMIDPEESYNPYYGTGNYINTPTALIENNTHYNVKKSLTQTVYADVTIIPELKWRTQASYWSFSQETYRYYPSTLPKKKEGEGGEAYRYSNPRHNINVESTLTYNKDWGKKMHLDVMGGFTWQNSKSETFSLSGSGYMNDELKWNNMGAVQDKNTYTASTSLIQKQKLSAIARANFNWRQRYYLTVSGRMDGASNFAANRKLGFFPSAALKWNIANEKFMRSAKNVDELSIKLSAGLTGNDAVSAYTSLAAMSSTTGGYLFNGSQPVAFYQGRMDSPDLTWEKTTLYNLALTGSFFNGRLNFTAEAYYSRTNDLLLSVKTAAVTGYTSKYANLGQTSNKGVELSIDSRNIVKKKFSWTTNFTISHNSQMVDNIGQEEYVPMYTSPGNNAFMMYGYKKGYPLNSLWGFKYAGVWHSEEEKEINKSTNAYISATSNQQLGNPKFVDVNHDGILNMDDLVYLGNSDPILYGGIQNNFSIGNFKVGVYFTYSLGGAIYNFSEFYMGGSRNTNQYRYMLNAWSPANPDSDYPRAGFLECHVPSSFLVHDASYIRLQNLSLGYTFKFKKKWIKDLTLTATGSNIWLWKYYNGFDPDVSSSGTSSTLRRLDIDAYPKSRKVIFSIQVRY